ncbi:Toprim domain-containing protein [Paracoccus halophilus]|uniref:Toprim domain-containing protein n=1 Tax=Paracoccus halophilus TaxID=376733 RepID=A0A099F3Z4_9RHOB|nr:toprim domain-containing protein [Paracoccus halophilus]KGJ04993.1 hypothetical protein IT41_08200 [Paracoccus halophilus]SFA39617.1 Toprim domain-containing protein [Paracoccus halophilus]
MSAREIVTALRGRPGRDGGLCFCPAHANSRTPALSISEGRDGRLLVHCHAGCRFEDIMDALRGLGLVEGRGSFSPPNPSEIAKRKAEHRAEAEKRANQARAIWKEAVPISGTLAENYLRSRGITCDLPNALRFRADCWHGPSAKRFPAMIAAVQGADLPAVHRTYLDGVAKARIEPNKMMLGATAGGAVRLSQADGPLVVAEGIETALSLCSGLLRAPAIVWACLSASGMAGLRLPDRPHRLTIATDGDDAGRAAGHKLAERAAALGWTVSILPAPEGKDWNDILIMKGAAA